MACGADAYALGGEDLTAIKPWRAVKSVVWAILDELERQPGIPGLA
jgi:hypothetical protein